MKFQVDNNVLTIDNNSVEFADDIEEVVDFENCLVVRTKRFNSSTLENVYGVNELAKISWRVPKMESIERCLVAIFSWVDNVQFFVFRVDEFEKWVGNSADLYTLADEKISRKKIIQKIDAKWH